ncbi:MAG TPA: R3H domain-containing nucleic acid-binding protein [Anaeromyxobacteraceae bacterium]|jgi:spoIIIJ-associated protein|nr:R3H domain-containing nucleic acid-binding protein [Anaeromyxobacteraceae bacterium]
MSEEREQGGPPPVSAPEKVARAREFCEELLRRMGGKVTVEVKETPEAIGVSLQAVPENELELGSALVEAVQYLVNRVVNPRAEGRKWVNLDVGGFADESDPVVQAMADRLALSVRRTGKVVAIAPITARERRQIHMALVGAEGVSTRSEGEGIFRQLLVVPEAGRRVPEGSGEGQ